MCKSCSALQFNEIKLTYLLNHKTKWVKKKDTLKYKQNRKIFLKNLYLLQILI